MTYIEVDYKTAFLLHPPNEQTSVEQCVGGQGSGFKPLALKNKEKVFV